MEASHGKRNIVIIGGGVMGCTTAYFLTRHPKFDPTLHRITILEATAVAAGASGKAGGLLATWAYPEPLVQLSYRLHRELAREHGGDRRWGYRRVGCGNITATVTDRDLRRMARRQSASPVAAAPPNGNGNGAAAGSEQAPAAADEKKPPLPIQSTTAAIRAETDAEKDWEKLPKQDGAAVATLEESPLPADLDWIDRGVVEDYEAMQPRNPSTPVETAQVHPYHFTTAMAQLARERGVEVRERARVRQIVRAGDGGMVSGVEYEDRESGASKTIEHVTDVVVTAGPWTGKLLPRSKVEGLRAHSVVFEADISPHAVFTDIGLPNEWAPEHRVRVGQKRKHRGRVDPEIYARPGYEVYACGEPDSSIPLPETADQVQTDLAQCDDLVAYIGTVSPVLATAPLKARQACYLPRHMRFGQEQGPLVGRAGVPGLWIAAGHTCWGIQNGPATGCLMAEMLLDGKASSADVEKFDPSKYKIC